ncbi:MAG: hypothetical protein KGJ79_01235 [Alphaproteobacteria bacterium]|nr:hypothetical protein [Alphaproteobacteria bacterium]MDE2109735.1 hypothetical protein [Alphaproteobacteria bacterium]MDE2494359.1 hypothetical protein [Alphaproteobacteria bacterium]
MIIFRGWGSLVFFVPFFWIFALIGISIGMNYHETDPAALDVMMYRGGALALALSAFTLWPICNYRARVAPGVDTFSFIPMRYWTWVALAGAIGLLGWSFFAT